MSYIHSSTKQSSLTPQHGFTIVEMIIVVIVIAILSTIAITSYNAAQDNSKTSVASGAASMIAKKAETANGIVGRFPVAFADSTAGDGTGFDNQPDTTLTNSGVTFAAISSRPTKPTTVEYITCGSGAGIKVSYWDYTQSTKITKTVGDTSGSCAAALTGTF